MFKLSANRVQTEYALCRTRENAGWPRLRTGEPLNAIGPSSGDFQPSLIQKAGALVWWYVDLVDELGNGAVCIWSYGLPFLPGVVSAARRGAPLVAATRPSWNLAIYRDGRPDFYVLQEVDPQACTWEPGHWAMGGCRFTQVVQDGRLRLDIEFDSQLAGPRLPVQGHLTMQGPLRTGLGSAEARNPRHSWEPLCLGSAEGQLSLSCGDYRAHVAGRAYHDRNGGAAPLSEIGLSAWRWGRFSFPHGDLVFTTVQGEGEDFVVWVDRQGRAERHEVVRAQERAFRSAWFGPAWPERIDLSTPLGPIGIHMTSLVDDAPFYQRALGTAWLDGRLGHGIAEHVLIDRLDRWWMRPLVQMRVDRGPRSSMWLPLFNGPRQHRGLRPLLAGGPS